MTRHHWEEVFLNWCQQPRRKLFPVEAMGIGLDQTQRRMYSAILLYPRYNWINTYLDMWKNWSCSKKRLIYCIGAGFGRHVRTPCVGKWKSVQSSVDKGNELTPTGTSFSTLYYILEHEGEWESGKKCLFYRVKQRYLVALDEAKWGYKVSGSFITGIMKRSIHIYWFISFSHMFCNDKVTIQINVRTFNFCQ